MSICSHMCICKHHYRNMHRVFLTNFVGEGSFLACRMLQSIAGVAACCSVLQRVAVAQCVALCCSEPQCSGASVVQRVAFAA